MFAEFPRLKDVAAKQTSAPTPQYNCIAWAFEDNTKWWWPMRRQYWPVPFDGKSTMEAFEDCLKGSHWERTEDRSVQAGVKKIALYASVADGQPTHAARQLETGAWTSKLGGDLDLTHELHELEGPAYGTVVAIYAKPY
ncbi:DUF7689 domain-containing protein [Tabrizicola sp.]|uniref:DUF7689 domain-containing protein n=1 Tax=Tabrizicola sp. TaxID=2005166 RepID=UPI003F37A90D